MYSQQKKRQNLERTISNLDDFLKELDIQVKINNRDLGLILLRIVELIGEDKLENLGSETLNFILITLNQLDLDTIRNKIILKTLPIRV